MNLPVFLNKVDAFASKMSHEDLAGFVHEIARTLPEERRSYFLDTLKNFSGQKTQRKIAEDDGYNTLAEDIEAIKGKLGEINDGKRCLESEYNEEWDDWYNPDADEVIFKDYENVLDDIDEAIELIHRCIDMELYKEGCELAELLSVLEVSADGDYNDMDGSPLSIHELDRYRLLDCDFKETVKECLYLTYMGNQISDRADEIFCMMENFECYDLSLENILQAGDSELPEFDAFLTEWIAYLGQQGSHHAGQLLREAQVMLPDENVQIANARKYAVVHPSLYKQFLEMKLDSGENEKLLQIGVEALGQIPESYVIRSQAALLTAEYACKLQDKDRAEACWLEAFRSDSTVLNYLRIRFRTRDWTKYKDAVKTIYEQVYKETEEKSKHMDNRYLADRQAENSLHKNEYCLMLFLEGQFEKVLETGMNEKGVLGWSMTFMKQGLALFLLLLYEGEEQTAGIKTMINMASCACKFDRDMYFKGTGESDDTDSGEIFWGLLRQWKSSVQIADNQREAWLAKIDEWIEARVEGIMSGNHRNYYGECASYIAALGEVQESLGIPYAKAHIMERYRSEYSRRRAFHQELRNYGMRK